MKLRIIVVIVLLFALTRVNGQESDHYWQNDFQSAKKISKKESKPILIFFTGSDWCGPCKVLMEDFFDTDEFKMIAQEKFVLYEADFPRNKNLVSKEQLVDNKNLMKKYKCNSFPTVVITNFKGRVLARRNGYNLMRDSSYYFDLLKDNY